MTYQAVLRLEDERRYRALGLTALVVGVLPVGLGAAKTLWLWQVLPASGWGERLRLVMPLVLGLG